MREKTIYRRKQVWGRQCTSQHFAPLIWKRYMGKYKVLGVLRAMGKRCYKVPGPGGLEGAQAGAAFQVLCAPLE